MVRPGHHPGAGPGDRKSRRAHHPPGAQRLRRPHLHYRGAPADRRELQRRTSAEVRACSDAVGGVHTGLSFDMGRDAVVETAVTALAVCPVSRTVAAFQQASARGTGIRSENLSISFMPLKRLFLHGNGSTNFAYRNRKQFSG